MIDDQVGAQRRALMAVLKAAKSQGVDIDGLCNAATEYLEGDPNYGAEQVAEAIDIISRANEYFHAPG